MQDLAIRFCSVSAEAEEVASFLADGLGLPVKKMTADGAAFGGAIFPAGASWIEVWPEAPGMPEGIMPQIVVDNADAWADNARNNGLDPTAPMDDHGERIYYLNAPVSFRSKLD
jgi:hypothetical protein